MTKEDKYNLFGIIFLGIMTLGIFPIIWIFWCGGFKNWRDWLHRFNEGDY